MHILPCVCTCACLALHLHSFMCTLCALLCICIPSCALCVHCKTSSGNRQVIVRVLVERYVFFRSMLVIYKNTKDGLSMDRWFENGMVDDDLLMMRKSWRWVTWAIIAELSYDNRTHMQKHGKTRRYKHRRKLVSISRNSDLLSQTLTY